MRSRRGFTLVEMLVAMALTIFIMVIVSQAFVTALQGFRDMKGVGDMQSKLRTATSILRRDLAADHFEGKRRLSDPNFWNVAAGGGPPREGFFRIQQAIGPADSPALPPPGTPAAPGTEWPDLDGNIPRRRTGHILHFTVKLRGNNRQDFFSATDPFNRFVTYGTVDARYQTLGVFNSQWAEVAYFLWRDPALPNAVPPTANGTPLFALYRRQRLAVPNNTPNNYQTSPINITLGSDKATVASYGQFSIPLYPLSAPPPVAGKGFNPNNPSKAYFNSPMDLTIPERRFGMNPYPPPLGNHGLPVPFDLKFSSLNYVPHTDPLGNLTGNDLLLSNVLSFDVQVIANSPSSLPIPQDLTNTPPLFDTWSTVKDDLYDYSHSMGGGGSSTPPLPPPPLAPVMINAVSITIRVWDPKTEQSRQVTIVQDL